MSRHFFFSAIRCQDEPDTVSTLILSIEFWKK